MNPEDAAALRAAYDFGDPPPASLVTRVGAEVRWEAEVRALIATAGPVPLLRADEPLGAGARGPGASYPAFTGAGLRLLLFPLAADGTLDGLLTTVPDDDPAAGVGIRLHTGRAAPRDAVTDEYGRFVLSGVSPGRAILEAHTDDEVLAATERVTLRADR